MKKKAKSKSSRGKHPGQMTRNEKQEQKGRSQTSRRQNETPERNAEERQGPGDRFPRNSYEGGRER